MAACNLFKFESKLKNPRKSARRGKLYVLFSRSKKSPRGDISTFGIHFAQRNGSDAPRSFMKTKCGVCICVHSKAAKKQTKNDSDVGLLGWFPTFSGGDVGEVFADVSTHVLSTTFPPTLRKGHIFRIRLASFHKIGLAPKTCRLWGWCL